MSTEEIGFTALCLAFAAILFIEWMDFRREVKRFNRETKK